MDDAVTWLIVMKPFWFLAAWLAGSVFAAFVALEKNRCGLCWFAMGILFGPLALITTVGLPVKPLRPPAGPKPASPEHHVAHPPAQAHAPVHAPVHGPAHGPAHAVPHGPAHGPVHGPGHGPLPHAPAGPIPPPLSPAHPAGAHTTHAAAHPPTAHHVDPVHAPVKSGFFDSALERPAGIAVVAIIVLMLLVYFASRHL